MIKKRYSAAYYKANREKILARMRAYRAANPEKARAQNCANYRAYYKANAKKINAKTLAWRAANPEKPAAYSRAYYKANREKACAAALARYKAKREKILAARRALRVRKRKEALDIMNGDQFFDTIVQLNLLKKYQNECRDNDPK
jgi:hypothetical protein